MASIRLPQEMEARLALLAAQTKRSKSFYVKEALEQYFENAARPAMTRAQRAARWLEENKEAIDAHNAWIDKHGVILPPLWEQHGAV